MPLLTSSPERDQVRFLLFAQQRFDFAVHVLEFPLIPEARFIRRSVLCFEFGVFIWSLHAFISSVNFLALVLKGSSVTSSSALNACASILVEYEADVDDGNFGPRGCLSAAAAGAGAWANKCELPYAPASVTAKPITSTIIFFTKELFA